MPESAHIQGLASSLTDVIALLVVVLTSTLAICCCCVIKVFGAIHRRVLRRRRAATQEAEARAFQEAIKSVRERWAQVADVGVECCVCLDSYKPNQLISILPCGHEFHALCMERWLLHGGLQPWCPLCKQELTRAKRLTS